MTRRERLERKLEKRKEWAEKREAEGNSSIHDAVEMLRVIPMGQPIMIGHHSERAHRRLLSRSDGAMRRGCESLDMAKHHANKAEGLEEILADTIFSDDPDAPERLREKIADLQAEHERMKAVNAIVRKAPKFRATEEKLAAAIALGLTPEEAAKRLSADRFGKIGYSLTNHNANIRRLQQRLIAVERMAARREMASQADGGVIIEGDKWVRLTFAEKPTRNIINALKAAGFHWGCGSWSGERDKIPTCVTTENAH